MKTRKQKEEDTQKLHEELGHVSTVILSTFQGVNVEQETMLRRTVESIGGRYKVVKNSVAERAAAGTAAETLLKGLAGANSISYTAADPVSFAKALTKLAKDIPAFEFKAGVVEGRVVSVDELVALAVLAGAFIALGAMFATTVLAGADAMAAGEPDDVGGEHEGE